MPIVPMPAKPTTGQPWLDVGYAWYDNVQQLITDVPQLKSDVLALQGTLANLQATRAPLANPSFTGTVSGVTAAMVGLGNVSNTADAAKTYSATQITSGTIPPARLPAGVAAVRRRTPANEAAPTATNWEPRPAGYPLVIAVGAAPAPSDAPATDLHVTPLTHPTAGTNFNGLSNGAAWPAPWVLSRLPTGGSATVQNNRGRLTSGNTMGNYNSSDGVAVRHSTLAANVEATFLLNRGSDSQAMFVARCDQPNLDPQNGVRIRFSGGSFSASQIDNWTYTSLASVTRATDSGTDYRLRIRINGSTVQARAWAATATEPSAWEINVTTTQVAAGYFGFVCGTGAAAASVSMDVDDITIT